MCVFVCTFLGVGDGGRRFLIREETNRIEMEIKASAQTSLETLHVPRKKIVDPFKMRVLTAYRHNDPLLIMFMSYTFILFFALSLSLLFRLSHGLTFEPAILEHKYNIEWWNLYLNIFLVALQAQNY